MNAAVIESENVYGSPWVRTQHGRFYLDAPVFNIEDVAHSLAMNCRFNGHTSEFYSVAQHSLVVSALMEDLMLGSPLEGLLHDATEAYMTDVPSPFKQCLPDWRKIDARLEIAARWDFGLPAVKTDGCKIADWYALFMEAKLFIPGGGEDFVDPLNLRKYAIEELLPDYLPHYRANCNSTPLSVKHQFLRRYRDLTGGP